MKWTKFVIVVCIAVIFTLTLAPRTSASVPVTVASTDPSGIFVSIYSECEVPRVLPCENRWDVVATAHDSVFLTFKGYQFDDLAIIFANTGWTNNPRVAFFYHDVYSATVSTDVSDPITRYHPDDQTAIALALDLASTLGAKRFSVDVMYLR